MPLSKLERLLYENPIRHWHEERLIRRLWLEAGRPMYGTVLYLGYADEHTMTHLRRRLKPRHLVVVDLDPAEARREARLSGGTALVVADPDNLPMADGAFDLVCTFSVFGRVPDWGAALGELARVLRPGGQFLFEDLGEDLFALLDIPEWLENIFGFDGHEEDERALSRSAFLDELSRHRLALNYQRNLIVEGWFEGVATKE